MAKSKTTYTGEKRNGFYKLLRIQRTEKSRQFSAPRTSAAVVRGGTRMWGPSIIGFGTYQYTYASGHEIRGIRDLEIP